MAYSCEQFTNDLRALGVQPGDLLFVHSSLKSLGPVEGGAATVITALERAIAPDGLVLMPSFNLVARDQRAATWDLDTTPSTVGYLTEFFRKLPGTCRSDHYSHSVAARGQGAEAFVADHRSPEGDDSPWDLAPWGKTYGTHSPMIKAYAAGGKVLMLGVDYHSSTYIHVVETRHWQRRRIANTEAQYTFLNRDTLGAFWDAHGTLNRGKVGDADCRLFAIRDFVDTLLEEVTRHSAKWLNG